LILTLIPEEALIILIGLIVVLCGIIALLMSDRYELEHRLMLALDNVRRLNDLCLQTADERDRLKDALTLVSMDILGVPPDARD
jgi:hypothetical protein